MAHTTSSPSLVILICHCVSLFVPQYVQDPDTDILCCFYKKCSLLFSNNPSTNTLQTIGTIFPGAVLSWFVHFFSLVTWNRITFTTEGCWVGCERNVHHVVIATKESYTSYSITTSYITQPFHRSFI